MPVMGLDSLPPADYAKVVMAFSTDIEERRRELTARDVRPSQIFSLLQNSGHEADEASGPGAPS